MTRRRADLHDWRMRRSRAKVKDYDTWSCPDCDSVVRVPRREAGAYPTRQIERAYGVDQDCLVAAVRAVIES